MVKVGDRVVVSGWDLPVYVAAIQKDPGTASVILHLDWKEFGKSRVFLHDQNKTWKLHNSSTN